MIMLIRQASAGLGVNGRPIAKLHTIYRKLHQKAYWALVGALGTTGHSLKQQIEREQLVKPNEFITNNANYLWELVKSSFAKKTPYTTITLIKKAFSLRWNISDHPRKLLDELNGVEHQIVLLRMVLFLSLLVLKLLFFLVMLPPACNQ